MLPLLLLLLEALPVIRDSGGGGPVAGATVVFADGSMAVSGADGSFPSAEGGVVSIRAVGYEPWTGSVPEGGIVLLTPSPIPSGRVEVEADRPGRSGCTLSSTEVEPLPGGDVHALTAAVPGLTVREYGAAAPVTSFSIRGSDPSQVAWSVLGHRLLGVTDGALPMSFESGLWDSIVFNRGGGSGGPLGGLAGSIELLPREPGGPGSFAASADTRGGAGLAAAFSPGGGLGLTASARRLTGPRGSRGRSFAVLALLGGGGVLVSDSRGGAESPDWTLPSDGTTSRTSIESWLSTRAGPLTMGCGLHAGSTGFVQTYPYPVDSDHSEASGELSASGAAPAGPVTLVFDVRLRLESVDGSSLGTRSRAAAAGGAGGAASLGDFELQAGLEADASTGGEPLLDGSLTLRWSGQEHVSAGLRLSSTSRRPTFNDLWWPEDAFATGNPDLDPERSDEIELLLSASGGLLTADLSLWAAEASDMIAWAPGEEGLWTPENILEASRSGLELSLGARDGDLSCRAGITASRCVDASGGTNDSRQLPYRPMLEWGLRGCWEGPARVEVTLTGTGRRYINASNTLSLDPFVLAGASATLTLSGAASLTIHGSNILDAEYEETSGFPGRPPTVGVSVGMEI